MSPGSEHQGGGAAGGCGGFRASHADRDHVIDMLKAAYVQGRLSKDEFDLRVSQAFGSRTWAELDALTGDILTLARVVPAPGRCHRPGRAIPIFVTAIASIGLVLLALLIAPSPAMRPASSPPARFTIADAERLVQCGKPGRHPSARLPAGFVAAAAVECVPALVRLAHGHGHPVITKQVADHGLAPLVSALRRPSVPPTPGVMCPLPLITVPVLFLIGPDEQIIRPVIPTDGCQMPLQQVLTALQRVPWVTASIGTAMSAPSSPARAAAKRADSDRRLAAERIRSRGHRR
jgi:Domain of unknown function (DUF1707)